MYIARFACKGQQHWGAVQGEEVVLLDPWCASMAHGIAQGWDALRAQAGCTRHPRVPLGEVQWLPPVEQQSKILCVGLNYGKHVAETGREQGGYPSLFLRHLDSFVGHEQNIIKPGCSDKFDFEGEVVVVMGREGRHISESDAMDYVAGYTCMAENSVRDFQKHTAQVTAGKNFDQSGALGPWIASCDQVGTVSDLALTTRLNGATVQHAVLADLIFSIPRLIAYISTFTTLRPGDLIATGTPEGIGSKRTPPLFMKAGDLLEVEVAGVGTLRTPVAQES
ncbi:MAG: fumarylacetoacetate hydrolase family protein [Pusillimonas sp.]